MNQHDLKLIYLHYAIKNELGVNTKSFEAVTKDQTVCLNRINEQIQELKKSGQEPKKVLALNTYTYQVLLEGTRYVDTTFGRFNVSYETDKYCNQANGQFVDVEVV